MDALYQAQVSEARITKLLMDIRLSRSGAFEDWVKGVLDAFILNKPLDEVLEGWKEQDIQKAKEAAKILNDYLETYPGIDLLGRVMCEMNLAGNSKNLGAFYTPSSVSKAIAKMQLHGLKLDQYPDGVTVLEPCVGAGSMALAVIETMFEAHGQEGLDKLRLTINDIDRIAVYCATYQILKTVEVISPNKSLGELVVFCGNALTVEHTLMYHFTGISASVTAGESVSADYALAS